MKKIPEFMMRVKLPVPGAYHSSPSGDTEYEDAFSKAIAAALPEGFEVVQPKRNQRWPVDSEGLTWVLLRCVDPTNAAAAWWEAATRAKATIDEAKELAAKILKLSLG